MADPKKMLRKLPRPKHRCPECNSSDLSFAHEGEVYDGRELYMPKVCGNCGEQSTWPYTYEDVYVPTRGLPERVQSHVDDPWNQCPFCASVNLAGGYVDEHDLEEDEVWVAEDCEDCGRRYVLRYLGTDRVSEARILAEMILDEGRKGPEFKTLKKNRTELTPEERKEVMAKKATWHFGRNGSPTPAVWKSVVDGKTWYVTNTHRAYNVRPTLKGAISRYHKFIKGTA